MTQQTDQGRSAARRVAVKPNDAAKLVTVTSDYSLPGVDWDYYNTVYKLLDFANQWPEGMAAHVAWGDSGAWRAVGLWDSIDTLDHFFGVVTIDRITRAIQLLGAVPSREGATNVEPERHPVVNLILGPLARSFADIGEDRDGSAIAVLNSEPTAIELDVSGLTPDLYAEVIERLGYAREIPAELISHHATTENDGMRIFEIWSNRGHALATLGGELLPAIEQIAQAHHIDLACDHTTHELRRIALSDRIVSAFGF